MQANNSNNYGYNKKLQPYANKLRKEMTKAEAFLWKYALTAKQRKYGFRRQRPAGYYIADFLIFTFRVLNLQINLIKGQSPKNNVDIIN